MPDIYAETVPGHRMTVRIRNEKVPGALVVVLVAEAQAYLPKAEYKEPWAVLHVDGERKSPKAITRHTRKEAEALARSLSTGEQLRTLRTRGRGGKQNSGSVPRPGAHVDPPPPPDKAPPQKKAKNVTSGEVEVIPPESDASGAVRQQDINEGTTRALRALNLDKIKRVIDEGMDATNIIWETQEIEDDDGKKKHIKVSTECVDHKTRLSAAKLALEYLIGKPLERQEIIERKIIDYSSLAARIEASPQAQKAMAEILAEVAAK